jgi:hypothetical protein
MAISDEKIEELLGVVRQTLDGMKSLQDENSALHRELISLLKAQMQSSSTAQTATSSVKYEEDRNVYMPRKNQNKPRPSRPVIEADIDDVEWAIFLDKWRHYKLIAELADEREICLELRESCSPNVNKLLYEFVGTDDLNATGMTEEAMIQHIKSVAVKTVHKEVYRWRYSQLTQGDSEHVTKYAGRLKSQAVLCDYKVTCGCGTKVSFANEMISQQLVTGLVNPEHQSRVMSEAQDLPDLKSKIDRLISLETTDEATTKMRPVTSKSSAARFSQYKRTQRAGLTANQDTRGRPKSRGMPRRRRCRGCGRTSHPNGKSLTREECPAFGETCNTCGLKNHFSKVCQRRSRSGFVGTDEEYLSGSDTDMSECNYSGQDGGEDTNEYEYDEDATESRHLAAKAQDFRYRSEMKVKR